MAEKLQMQIKVYGEGTPLLLVPGGLTGWKSWEPFVDIFLSKHKKVICVQLLSVQYGLEDRALPAGYSVKTESGALASALESLGILQPLDVLAWSYGAMISLDFALDHPERIRTLALIEPPAIWVLRARGELKGEALTTVRFFETLHGDITENMLEAFMQSVGIVKPGQAARETQEWPMCLPFRQSLKSSPAVVSHTDEIKRLENFHKPVLLAKGTGSAPFLHLISDGLAASLPDSRLIEMPAGHAPHIVSRDKFLAELELFQK